MPQKHKTAMPMIKILGKNIYQSEEQKSIHFKDSLVPKIETEFIEIVDSDAVTVKILVLLFKASVLFCQCI